MRSRAARFAVAGGILAVSFTCPVTVGSLRAALPSEPVEAPALHAPELADLLARVRAVAAGDAWQAQGWRDPLIEGWLGELMSHVRTATGDDKRVLPVTFADVQPQPQEAQAAAAAGPVGDVDRIVVNGVERLVVRAPVATAPAASAPAAAPASAPASAPAAEAGAAEEPQPQQQQRVVNAARRVQPLNGALIVGGNVEFPHAQRSIILSDGNVRVSFATDCVIVARGTAYVAHGRGNVIVAGHFVHVSHDGERRPVRNAGAGGFARGPNGMPRMEVGKGGVIASGAVVDVSHANGTVFAAGEALRVSHAYSCTFINGPADAAVPNQQDCRQVEAPGMRVAAPRHPLAARVQLDWLTPNKGAVIRFADRRHVADVGKPITDEAGKAVAGLEGWVLTFCDQGYALFTNGRDDFGVVVPAQQQR